MKTLPYFLSWWCETLVRTLLAGAYWMAMIRDTETARRRFDHLVYGCDCWPCRVSWSWGNPYGIQVSAGADWENDMDLDLDS